MAEVYTIKQVTDLTNVPENTIRSWERRFGWPTPTRTSGKQRRYTSEHLDQIRRVAADRAAGRTIEQALTRIGVYENDEEPAVEVPDPAPERPRLLPSPPAANRRPNPLLPHLVAGDLAAANRALSESYVTIGMDETIIWRLVPATREIEHLGLAGEVDALRGRTAESWLERKAHALFEQSSPEAGNQRVLVAPIHDDGHELRALWLAVCLSRAGFAVATVSRPLDIGSLRASIESDSFDAVIAVGESSPSGQVVRAAFPEFDLSNAGRPFLVVCEHGSGNVVAIADGDDFGEAVQHVIAALRQSEIRASRSIQ